MFDFIFVFFFNDRNPLAGLILRVFNLPTGTILINVWFKV